MARIEGMNQLHMDLRNMAVSRSETERIVRKWAEYVRGEATERAPVDTGALRQSIHTDTEWDGDTCTGIIYTNLEYAIYVEFGVGRRGAASLRNVPSGMTIQHSPDIEGQRAQPYLYPALHNNEERIMRGMREDFAASMRG